MNAEYVLIADNDHAVSSLLVDVLARHGLDTVCAYGGEAAGKLALDPRVCVMVCDLDMPKRTGLEVLEALPAGRSLPTVVVSGYLDAAVEARLAGFDFVHAVLKKPFDLFVFADLVARLAKTGRSGAERAVGTEH